MKNMSVISKILNISPSTMAYWLTKGNYQIPKHIEYIERLILKSIASGSKYLCINMPPRHGKSEYLSKFLPLWYLTTFPDKRIILTSYESSFAAEWGQKVKSLLSENADILGISISRDQRSSSFFALDGSSGSMSCVGAGGPITGKGADLLIIDDPVKNDAEANSKHQRDMLFEWFKDTAFTRIEPGGIMILLMTRWHEDDLCGRLKAIYDNDSSWEFLSIPAFAESNDILSRDVGEALWEKRYNEKKLNDIKKALGKYWFSALYQQAPSPADGAVFNKRHFKYFSESEFYFTAESERVLKSECKYYATVDLAISTSEMADYSVVLVFAVSKDKKIFITEIIREHFDPTHHFKIVEQVNKQYSPVLIGIESVQYQVALVKELSRNGIPVKKLTPHKDKLSRALQIVSKIELGDIYFLRYAPWLQILESEMLEFPNGKHDDQVDCLSYIHDMIGHTSDVLPSLTNTPSKRENTFISKYDLL